MNILARYRKLAFWNKIAFWGAIVSIGGFPLFLIFQPFTATRKNQLRLMSESATQQILQKDAIRLLKKMEQIDATDYKTLIQDYPSGYVLFSVKDGEEIITLNKKRLPSRIKADWNTTRVVKLTTESITLNLPSLSGIQDKDNIPWKVNFVFLRKIGDKTHVMTLQSLKIQIYFELLFDDGKNIIFVIGFTDFAQDTLRQETYYINMIKKMEELDKTECKTLLKRYPLGYILLATKRYGGTITPNKNRLSERYAVDLDESAIWLWEECMCIIMDIYDRKNGIRLSNIISQKQLKDLQVHREVQNVLDEWIINDDVKVIAELLENDGESVIWVLGFKDNNKQSP